MVIFENLSASNREYEVVQDSSLVWAIVASGKKGSKIADIAWCRDNLKDLVQVYASDVLKFTSKKLTWKFSRNPHADKGRLLWYVLYKLHARLAKHDLSMRQVDGVRVERG